MNLISEKQARAITGGRMPLVPVEYEAAKKALAACLSIDEAKYWSDKSDALAAWAKIYNNDEVGIEAKKLKIHAYRRMGELAALIQPSKRPINKTGLTGGFLPGAKALLRDNGLNASQAQAARRLALMPLEAFEEIIASPSPPPIYRIGKTYDKASKSWETISSVGGCLMGFRSFCRKYEAADLARFLYASESDNARRIIVEVREWIDKFEQHLPKSDT